VDPRGSRLSLPLVGHTQTAKCSNRANNTNFSPRKSTLCTLDCRLRFGQVIGMLQMSYEETDALLLELLPQNCNSKYCCDRFPDALEVNIFLILDQEITIGTKTVVCAKW
jgi:hypothetical protein